MFRGKESSNRIKISWLVQELLNFGILGSLQLWGGGRCFGGVCRHLWACGVSLHTCTHTWRHPCLSCLTYMWVCVCIHACMHVHVCAWCTPPHTNTHPQPNPPTCKPLRGTPGISQNSITLELMKIIQFCLKIWILWRISHPWVGA